MNMTNEINFYKMKKIFSIIAVAAAFCSAMVSCTCSSDKDVKAEHVFLIGLDGWGSYSVEDADMPNVKALMSEGCYTLQKRAVLPSKSAVNWASMFMGVPTEVHGYIRWDSMDPDIPVYQQHIAKNGILPTIFQILRDQKPESEIGCIYEWDGIKYLIDTVSVNYHAMTPDYTVEENYGAMSKMACEYIKEKKPNLAAFIYDNPDYPGHMVGFHTPAYYENLKRHDKYVGEIIAAIKEAGIYDESIIIITSDHGGIEKDHGGFDLNEMETPFIIAGKNVKKGGEFKESMMQYDVAATIAEIFGLEIPQVWTAKSMSNVFID